MASLFGIINEETPKFDILKKASEGYEIRKYHRQLRASITIEDKSGAGPITEKGFRELAGYIFGGNKKRDADQKENIAMTAPVITTATSSSTNGTPKVKIAMTAPVITDADASKKTTTMSFVLPSKYQNVEDLPIPNDSNVKIEEVEGYTVAALQFSGSWTPDVTVSQTKRLVDLLRDDKEVTLTVEDESKVAPIVARYNPPWTLPFLRTNEIMIPVTFIPEE